jgi:small subunit ribosomal protein S3
LGQKTNPIGFRLGIVKTWDSKWFAKRDYANLLEEDLFIRKYLKTRLNQAGVSKILIERAAEKVTVTIRTARPGIVIGRRGQQVDQLRDELQHTTGKQILLNVEEVRRPDADAQLVADHIARQLEQRVSFRRAMKKSLTAARRSGALGIRVACSGRLGGSEMARSEQYRDGRVPLHTLRADIDFAIATAHTTYGCIGVKTWIFHGEILGNEKGQDAAQAEQKPRLMKPRQSAMAGTAGPTSGG